MTENAPKLPPSLELYFAQLDVTLKKLMDLTNELKVLESFEVFETNADLEQIKLVFSNVSLDLAETVAAKKFIEGGYEIDYMLIKHNGQWPISLLLSNRSSRLRGEDLS